MADSDFVHYPSKALDIRYDKPKVFSGIQAADLNKRNIIHYNISTMYNSVEMKEKLKEMESKPLTCLMDLMDELELRSKVEANWSYWTGDVILKMYGLLPDDHEIEPFNHRPDDYVLYNDREKNVINTVHRMLNADIKDKKNLDSITKSMEMLLNSDNATNHEYAYYLQNYIKGKEEVEEKVDKKPMVDMSVIQDIEKEIASLKHRKGFIAQYRIGLLKTRLKSYMKDVDEFIDPDKEEKSVFTAKAQLSINDQRYYRLVPKACACFSCANKEYRIGEDKEDKMQMHLLKKTRVDRWYDLVWNREVIEYCSFHNIEPDNHVVIQDVKRRLAGIDFNPKIILPANPWIEVKHNNWYLPDVSKDMVKKVSFPIAEGRSGHSYLFSHMDKLPIRIEQIAIDRINQCKTVDKRFVDMTWETRRKRLCYYYYRWFGIKSYHPHMFESSYTLCLMRLARVMQLSLEVRLYSLRMDVSNMNEMRQDLYRLWMVKEKNWGQKDVVANYYNNAGAYLRQVYLECQILVIEFGDQVRSSIPEYFNWLELEATIPGKMRTNYKLKRGHIPIWANWERYSKVKAGRNRDTPLEDIMKGKYDEEAGKIWKDEPYFMDPQEIYDMRHEREPCIFRAIDRYRHRAFKDETHEKRIYFKEHKGDMKSIGTDFQRLYMRFVRPRVTKKPPRPKAKDIYEEVMEIRRYDRDEVKSINDLPELKVAYRNLVHELGYNTDFPIKEVTYNEYDKKYRDEKNGPNDYKYPVMYCKDEVQGCKPTYYYWINKNNLKLMMKTQRFREIYNTVKWYYNMVITYRKDRNVRSGVYDDMMKMLDVCHVDEKYHLGCGDVGDIDDVIFGEFDKEYAKKKIPMKCEYLDKIVTGSLMNIKLLMKTTGLNQKIAAECLSYYFLTTKRMMSMRNNKWIPGRTQQENTELDNMWWNNEEMQKRSRLFMRKITEPADIIVTRFAKNLRHRHSTDDTVRVVINPIPDI